MRFDYQNSVDFDDVLRVNLLYDPKNVKCLVMLGALQLVRFHQYQQAIGYLKQALTYDEKSVSARFWLGTCFHQMHNFTSAHKIVDEALELDCHRADCLSLKAYLIWDEGIDLEKNIAYIKEAIQSAPFWPMLHIELTYLYMNLGCFKEALQQIQIMQPLMKIAPTTPSNAVEAYYEKMVTGRSWTDLPDRLHNLQLNIEKKL